MAKQEGALKRERVRDFLLELVESRSPGDAIPSERVLCAELEVARPTLRSAIDELVRAGMLVREHGRGTFVAERKITQELVSEDRTLALPLAQGVWESQVLTFETMPAGPRVGRRLRVSPGAPTVYVSRLRLVDGEPMAIEHLYLPQAIAPGLTLDDLESGCLYERLRDRHGVHVHEAVQSMEATVTQQSESELLAVPDLSPALLFERLTTDTTGRPVEYVHSIYRGDRYRTVSRLTLGDQPGGAPAEGPSGTPRAAGEHHPGIPPDGLVYRGDLPSSTVGEVQPAF